MAINKQTRETPDHDRDVASAAMARYWTQLSNASEGHFPDYALRTNTLDDTKFYVLGAANTGRLHGVAETILGYSGGTTNALGFPVSSQLDLNCSAMTLGLSGAVATFDMVLVNQGAGAYEVPLPVINTRDLVTFSTSNLAFAANRPAGVTSFELEWPLANSNTAVAGLILHIPTSYPHEPPTGTGPAHLTPASNLNAPPASITAERARAEVLKLRTQLAEPVAAALLRQLEVVLDSEELAAECVNPDARSFHALLQFYTRMAVTEPALLGINPEGIFVATWETGSFRRLTIYFLSETAVRLMAVDASQKKPLTLAATGEREELLKHIDISKWISTRAG